MNRSGPVVARAPGRVNLVGEHTDYNDGCCLPFAIAAGITVTARPLDGARVEVTAADLGERDAFALDAVAPADGWRAYVRGVAAELRAAGHPLRGAELVVRGDLPRGAGLSSSAALEVATALALLGVAGVEEVDRLALAELCSRVEHVWVGARTGLLDQIAVLLCEPGAALHLDLRSLSMRSVPLALGDWRLAVLDSGAGRSVATAGYNARREECARACERLGVASLRHAPLAAAAVLPAPLDRRVRHVVTENARVETAVAALESGDLPALGALLDASHASLRDDYEVSVPEVEAAVAAMREAGAAGARLIGGGFGGSVLGLFAPGAAPPPGAFAVTPGAPAGLIAAA